MLYPPVHSHAKRNTQHSHVAFPDTKNIIKTRIRLSTEEPLKETCRHGVHPGSGRGRSPPPLPKGHGTPQQARASHSPQCRNTGVMN